MRKILFSISLILFSIFLNAEYNYEWEWVLTAGSLSSDTAYFVDGLSDGEILIGGCCNNNCSFGNLIASSNVASGQDYGYYIASVSGSSGDFSGLSHSDFAESNTIVCLDVDSDGNIIVAGQYSNEIMLGNYYFLSAGYSDIFVGKMDSAGEWLWATTAGGQGDDIVKSMDVDSMGNIFLSGYYTDDTVFGQYTASYIGGSDGFVTCIDSTGTFQWLNSCKGLGNECITDVVQVNEKVFFTGYFSGEVQLCGQMLTSLDGLNSFVACANNMGIVEWINHNTGNNSLSEIVLDSKGNIYVTGGFLGTLQLGDHSVYSNSVRDIFVAKMDTSRTWNWVKSVGGLNDDYCKEMICYNDRIFICGYVSDQVYFDNSYIGDSSERVAFIAEIDSLSNWNWVQSLNNCGDTYFASIYVGNDDDIYVAGSFRGNIEVGNQLISSQGENDILVAKLSDPNHSTEDNTIFNEPMHATNYPNPFNPETTIEFTLTKRSNVELTVYNIKGQKVKTLVSEIKDHGLHKIIWKGDDDDGRKIGSGVYFYKLYVDGRIESVKKCVMLK